MSDRGVSCRHCSATSLMTETEARAVGWRIWHGTTMGGQQTDDVVCARCAGNDTSPPPSWKVGCRTCDWEWVDEYDEGPLDEKAAKHMADDHECEPETWVKAPDAKEAVLR